MLKYVLPENKQKAAKCKIPRARSRRREEADCCEKLAPHPPPHVSGYTRRLLRRIRPFLSLDFGFRHRLRRPMIGRGREIASILANKFARTALVNQFQSTDGEGSHLDWI